MRIKNIFVKLRDKALKEKVLKQISKIKNNPESGKLMRNVRKGAIELYIKPFRLSYSYDKNNDKAIILDLYHKDEQ